MNTPQPGEKYRHFKGDEYEVICIGKHSETEEELLVYKGLYGDNPIWIRPLSMFLDTKTLLDGTEIQRFTKID